MAEYLSYSGSYGKNGENSPFRADVSGSIIPIKSDSLILSIGKIIFMLILVGLVILITPFIFCMVVPIAAYYASIFLNLIGLRESGNFNDKGLPYNIGLFIFFAVMLFFVWGLFKRFKQLFLQ